MIYVFDIDGTVCANTDGDYKSAKPFLNRVQKINDLYKGGNKIIFMTARGMGRSDNDRDFAYKEFYDFTYNQLKSWGLKFHELYLGKPEADIFIDDKGMKDNDFFGE